MPVATARSKEFNTENLTMYAQSYTDVMATVAQAEHVMSSFRNSRFPSCDSGVARAEVIADVPSSTQVSALKVLVEPGPPGVSGSDSLTIFTSDTTQEAGAQGTVHTVAHLMVLRKGRVVTYLMVSSLLTAGPFPALFFDRLALRLAKRLAGASRTDAISG
jgi:hypothetical protein